MEIDRSAESSRLDALRRYHILDTLEERDFDDICKLAAEICEAPMALVSFLDEDRQWFKSKVGVGMSETPLDHAICRHAILHEEPLIIPDTLIDPRTNANPLCTGEPRLRFYAGAPIRTADGFALGTVCVLDQQPRQLKPNQVNALKILSHQIMTMLERKRAEASLLERNRLAVLRSEINALCASSLPLETILQHCTEILVLQLEAAFARIWTLEEGSDVLCLRASAGIYTHLDGPHSRVKVGDFKIGRIASRREPHLTNSAMTDPEISDPEWARREKMTAFAGYPLLIGDRVVGVVGMFSKKAISAGVIADLAPLANGIAQCIARKWFEEKLKASERNAIFLSEASASLANLTDYQSTLQKITSIAVPGFADWCAVDLREEKELQRLAISHADPAQLELARELTQNHPIGKSITSVFESGQPEFYPDISDTLLDGSACDPGRLQNLRKLGFKSCISIPLKWRAKTLGVLTFATAQSGRTFSRLDMVAAQDFASRAAVAIENAALYRELRAADQRKDEFLATLAHELRNPLAPVINALELLKTDGPNAANFGEMRTLMERQLMQMVHLIDDLLDISRVTSNKLDLRKQRIELAEALRDAMETSRPLIEKGGHEFSVSIPPESIWMDADPVRLAQLFSNILNNAAKYTSPGGRISLEVHTAGGETIVRIKDTGIGIAPEMLPRVFEMFAQADRSLERSQGGLGIGLTLVRRLVEMHGGTVYAHSEGLGKGSKFVVRLPIVKNGAALHPSPAAPASLSGKNRRILLVEDNQDTALTMGRLLKRRGYDVQVTHDGEQALAIAGEVFPHIVLLDIGLPKMNGYDVARTLRTKLGSKSILIAMTGWGQENDLREAKEAGFDHHVLKPVNFEHLKSLLATCEIQLVQA